MVALGLRAWGLTQQCLSMDEWYDVNLAGKSVAEIIRTGDGFPPLYHLMLHTWINIWGESQARSLSVLFGVATVVVLGNLAQRIAGERVGLFATAVAAVLPLHVWFSQEARCYALLLLLTALALRSCWSLIACPNPLGYAAVALFLLAGLYTHYFFGFVVLTCGTVLLWRLGWRLPGGGWWWGLGSALALIPLCILLWADLQTQLGWGHKQWFGVAACGYTYFTVLSGFTLGPSLEELHSLSTAQALRQFLPWIVSGGLGLAGVGWSVVRHSSWRSADGPRPSRFRDGLMLAILSGGPVVVGLACNLLDVGYQVRYSLWATAPMVIGLGWSIAIAWQKWSGKMAVGALAAMSIVALMHRHHDPRYANPDVRSAARVVAAGEPCPIVVVSAYMVPVFEYYLPNRAQPMIRMPNQFESPTALATLQQLVTARIPAGTEFWLVLCREYHDDPQGELTAWLRAESELLEEHLLAGVRLAKCRRLGPKRQ